MFRSHLIATSHVVHPTCHPSMVSDRVDRYCRIIVESVSTKNISAPSQFHNRRKRSYSFRSCSFQQRTCSRYRSRSSSFHSQACCIDVSKNKVFESVFEGCGDVNFVVCGGVTRKQEQETPRWRGLYLPCAPNCPVTNRHPLLHSHVRFRVVGP